MTFVTNLTDATAGSLRAAIASATAVGGDGVVDFAAGLNGTITLASTLTIAGNLTINGPGAINVSVSGNNAVRVFIITAGNVTIRELGITGGSSSGSNGGGIQSAGAGSLNLINDFISNNAAAAGFGGGLALGTGAVTINGCTFSGNTAFTGGGISTNLGAVTIINSTFFNNRATGGGSFGGAFTNFVSITTMINCTITGNNAVFNGGGIAVFSGTANLINTIVSGNTAGNNPDVSGTIAVATNSIFGTAPTITTNNNSLVNTNPLLAPGAPIFQGGLTPTIGLQAGSVAIARGTNVGNNIPFVDERDLPRGFNAIDVGAFQTQTPLLAAGTAGAGVALNTNLSTRFNVPPNLYGTAEVRTAMGDVNGDGVPDLVTVAGPGGGSVVIVFDGKTGAQFRAFAAITTGTSGSFSGQSIQFGTNAAGTNLNLGFFVASGDVDGDGFADVIIGFDGSTSGPLVNIFSGKVITNAGDPTTAPSGGILASYNSFPAPGGGVQFNGGVRVAAGDFDNDGRADVLAVPGIGGGPLVSVYSGQLLTTTNNANDAAFIISFNAYPIANWPATGLFVAIADVDHDGWRDIILGPGGTGGATLFLISGRNLLAQFKQTPTQIDNTTVGAGPISLPTISYSPPFNAANGIRVATADVTGDGFGDIVLGGGSGNGPLVQVFQTNANAAPTIFSQQSLFNPLATTGLFVGGGPV